MQQPTDMGTTSATVSTMSAVLQLIIAFTVISNIDGGFMNGGNGMVNLLIGTVSRHNSVVSSFICEIHTSVICIFSEVILPMFLRQAL